MKPELSEFSYGYALTEDIIRGLPAPLAAAPVLPSLADEGSTLGYDLMLSRPGLPLFLQFKVSEWMKARSAKEYAQFLTPYYRMKIWSRKRSSQQGLLLNLESSGGDVYYVAPGFHRIGEFDQAYRDRQVRQRSIFVKPSFIGSLTDDAEHHVAFRAGAPGPWTKYFCSEAVEIREATAWEDVVASLIQRLRGSSETLEATLTNAAADMSKIVQPRFFRGARGTDFLNALKGRSSLEQVAYLAHTFFECAVLLVSERPPDETVTE